MLFQSRKRLCDAVIPTLDSLSMAIKSSHDLKLDEQAKWKEAVQPILADYVKDAKSKGIDNAQEVVDFIVQQLAAK